MKLNKKTTFYISIAGMDPGWIVGKLAEDIKTELEIKGFKCNYGPPSGYNNEDICHHMGWAYAIPKKNAKINSLFITHIDDNLKEKSLVSLKDKFDLFICMSHEYESFLIELGFDKNKVFGLTLPTRNKYIKPISLGIFSSYYSDGRKNEKWLLKFCKNNKDISYLNFVFIGPNWEKFLQKFINYNCSFEWHNTSRQMPYEYNFQQNKLLNLDYYFYLGFDGGAMGTYDAYAYGNKLLISNQCYHKSIPDVDHLFNDYDEFEKELKKIVSIQKNKINFFHENSPKNYVIKLLEIWDNKENYRTTNKPIFFVNAKKRNRNNYQFITLRRLLSAFKRFVFNKVLKLYR